MPDHCETIYSIMPYKPPFLFVDKFIEISEMGSEGYYRFKEEEYFYLGHFPEKPVTPGVILIECMAQIGLVGLGMYLKGVHLQMKNIQFGFTSAEVKFKNVVLPGELVFVKSEIIFFKFEKLKCKVTLYNESKEKACIGTLSGMIIN